METDPPPANSEKRLEPSARPASTSGGSSRSPRLDHTALDGVAVAIVATDRNGRIVHLNPKAEELFGYDRRELLGRSVELLVPRGQRRKHALERTSYGHAGQPLAAGRVLSAERKDGTVFPVEIVLGSATTPEGPVHYATLIDVSAREAVLARQIERQSALADLGQLGLGAPVQQLLDEAASTVTSHLGVDRVLIYELSRDRRTLQARAAVGASPSGVISAEVGTAGGFLMSQADPVMVQELAERGLLDQLPISPRGVGGACVRIEAIGGRPYGLLAAVTASERWLDVHEVSFLRSVASIVSGAIDLAQREPLFELSEDMLAVADQEGYLVRLNPAGERILGWTANELAAQPFVDFVHPDSREAAATALARLQRGDEAVVDFEIPVRTKSGEYRDLLASARSSPDGRWIYAAMKDISVRKREEVEAARAAAENELILRSAAEGIVRVAGDGTISYVNEVGAELLGRDPEQMIGRDAVEVFLGSHAEERSARTWLEMDASDGDGGAEPKEAVDGVFWRADGTWFEAAYTAAPVWSHEDTQGAVIVFSDVTARRRLQAEAQLKQNAEQANQAKSEFLSRMSHELRTPLNAILGFGQLLGRAPLAERERRFCEFIVKGGQHLQSLIDDVLDISRIDSGTLRISVEPVRLADAVGEALELIGPMAERHGITVEADLGEHAETYVSADLQRLKQIVLNLLSNAIKYNRPSGSVRITARSDERTLTLAVADTGHGIAAHQLPSLFSPFERLGAETTQIEGTGLGLALSRQLAEAMGGSLDVESEVGVGSTFQIRLSTVAPPPIGGDGAATAHARPNLSGRTVLCIEDNAANLRLIEYVLADADLTAISAATGRLGVDLAITHDPEVILLDLNLPDMSGRAVLDVLRAEPATAATPVVVVTADASDRERQQLLEHGANAYLTKPFDVDALLDAVAEALGSN